MKGGIERKGRGRGATLQEGAVLSKNLKNEN
jgi:hypothetical protein